MKKVFCMMDTETTGLEWHHEIIEIAMVLFNSDFEKIGSFVTKVNALHHRSTFSDEAMQINGFDPAKVRSHGMSAKNTACSIKNWINVCVDISKARVIPAGQNIIKFDIPKIKQFVMPDFDNFFSDRVIIDTKRIADFFNIRGEFESTSLQELAKVFNIPVKKAHSALDDCYTCLEVLKHFYAGR